MFDTLELGLDTFGDVTVRLAEEFGFCYGVDRAVDYAYETRHKFPEKRIYLVGEAAEDFRSALAGIVPCEMAVHLSQAVDSAARSASSA